MWIAGNCTFASDGIAPGKPFFRRGEFVPPPSLGDILNAARRCIDPYTAQVDTEVRILASAYRKGLRKLQRAAMLGSVSQARARQQWMMTRSSSLICAYLLGAGKVRSKFTFAQIKQRVATLNVRSSTGESVHVWAKEKRSGGHRFLCSFGPEQRCKQRLLADVLRSQWGESKFEYARKGKGPEASFRAIDISVKNGGVRWIINLDIKDCFGSYALRSGKASLPLPKSIIENTILIPRNSTIRSYNQVSLHSVRVGLPQGSLCSPLISSKLLEPVLEKARAIVVVGYADDHLIGAKNEKDAQAIKDALVSDFRKHPAGPLRLKHSDVLRVGSKTDWLGAWPKNRHIWKGPRRICGTRVAPSERTITRAQGRVMAMHVLVSPSEAENVVEFEARKLARRFPEWGKGQGPVDFEISCYSRMLWAFAHQFRQQQISERRCFTSFAELGEELAKFSGELWPELEFAKGGLRGWPKPQKSIPGS